MERCNCGRTYETATGAALCEANNHGEGVDKYGDSRKLVHTVETEIVVNCAECLRSLRSSIRKTDGGFEIDVLPHVCELPEAEE
jgi:hypothetical protein